MHSHSFSQQPNWNNEKKLIELQNKMDEKKNKSVHW